MFLYKLLIVPILLFCFWQLSAQKYSVSVEYFNVEQGLSNRFVRDIFQDSRGFIWISTSFGLNRYDGHSFQVFTKEKSELQSNTCKTTLEDALGNLWIIYQGDHGQKDRLLNGRYLISVIDIYNYTTGKFQPLEQCYPVFSFLKNRHLSSIEYGINHSIWLSTFEGELFLFDGALHLIYKTSDNTPILTGIGIDSTFWIMQTNQVQERSRTGRILHTYHFPNLEECEITTTPDKTLWFTILYECSDGNKCCQTYAQTPGDSLRIFKVADEKQGFAAVQTENLHQIIHTSKGDHWLFIPYQKGFIKLYDACGNLLYNLPQTIYTEENLKQFGFINQLFLDTDDLIWASTDNGIIKIKLHKSFFQPYLTTKGQSSSRGIARIDDDHIWVNTHGGWGVIDLKTNQISPNACFGTYKSFEHPTQGYGAWCLDSSYMLIGTYGMDLYKVRLQDGKIIKTYTHPDLGRAGILFQSSQTKKIWLATESGLFFFDPQQDAIFKYEAPPGSLLKNIPQRVNSFLETREGLWLCTSEGLLLLDEQKGIQAIYKDFPHLIFDNLHIDKDGIFWIATKGGGLLQWNRKTNEVKQYTKENGLSDNVIYAVYEDKLGYLWLPSNYGLMRFDKKTKEVNLYLPKDGIAHEEFNFNCHYQMPDGRLIFGGLNGIIVFRPEEIPQAFYKAPLRLTTFQESSPTTGEMLDKTGAILQSGMIKLAHAVKSFYLEFTLMDFSDVSTHRFAYLLEGYDPTWHYQKENYLRINKLPADKYTLRIRGQGSRGLWSSQELIFPIVVLKPFYRQTWFILLAIGLLAFGIYLYLQQKTASLRASERQLLLEVQKRTQELESINATKDKLFSIIGHELRGPLFYFQNIGENLNYLLQKGDLQRATEIGASVKDTAKRVNHILDNLLYWGLTQTKQLPYRPQAVSLQTSFSDVCELFEDIGKYKNIQLYQKVLTDRCVYVDERALSTILRNLVSNAIKFTPPCGKIELIAKLVPDNRIQILVQDSGIGMPAIKLEQLNQPINPSQVGTQGEKGIGLGLSLCRELVAKNRGDIHIESQLKAGTKVFVILPAY